MTESIPVALYLPTLDIEALIQPKTIVVMPRRYLNPGQKFALYPVNYKPERPQQEYYNTHFLETTKKIIEQPSHDRVAIKAWAKCEDCKMFDNSKEFAILSQLTIWAKATLEHYLSKSSFLFLAYLRVFQLPEAIAISPTSNADNKLGKIAEISQAIAIAQSHPVFDDAAFSQECKRIETRQLPTLTHTPDKNDDNCLEWIKQIAEIGNSSDGDRFEKLVRRSLIFLGFSNSNQNPKASLDPNKTGGRGGLDFYAEQPYFVVGECKATKTDKVTNETPSQLIKLGYKFLTHYASCIKIIFAAGQLTSDVNQVAIGNRINVIRPETLEKLVQLKAKFPGTVDLFTLKTCLEREPFGEAADRKVNEYYDRIITELKIRSQLVEIVKQTQQNLIEFVALKGIYTYSHPSQVLNEQQIYNILIELSSPLTGYLGREKGKEWRGDRFYFLRDLPIENSY
ncbi:MAG: DUF1802 family protein [Cyanobacteria bacterium P01_E01_bin.42]